MGEALIEHAEHDIDRDERRQDQQFLRRGAVAKHFHVTGKIGPHRVRQMHLGHRLHDGVGRGLERGIGGEVPGDGRGRILGLVIDGKRRVGFLKPRECGERNLGGAA